MKRFVHYIGTPSILGIGKPAYLTPVDHPDRENVSNNHPVQTSPVVVYDAESGYIETKNTRYVPHDAADNAVWPSHLNLN